MAIDYDAIFGVEDFDPCAALMQLRPAYMKLVAGGPIARITFRDRTTEWHRSDLTAFGNVISQLEQQCMAKKGIRPRQAITAGFRRQF